MPWRRFYPRLGSAGWRAGGPGLAVFETWVSTKYHRGKVVTSRNFSLCALQSFSRIGPASW
jgi:hypothetical protein